MFEKKGMRWESAHKGKRRQRQIARDVCPTPARRPSQLPVNELEILLVSAAATSASFSFTKASASVSQSPSVWPLVYNSRVWNKLFKFHAFHTLIRSVTCTDWMPKKYASPEWQARYSKSMGSIEETCANQVLQCKVILDFWSWQDFKLTLWRGLSAKCFGSNW